MTELVLLSGATVPQPHRSQKATGPICKPRTTLTLSGIKTSAICHRLGHEGPHATGIGKPLDGDGAPKDRILHIGFAPCVSGPGLTNRVPTLPCIVGSISADSKGLTVVGMMIINL